MPFLILLLIVAFAFLCGWCFANLTKPQPVERAPRDWRGAPIDPYALDEDPPRVAE
jgi:hypothetical protein